MTPSNATFHGRSVVWMDFFARLARTRRKAVGHALLGFTVLGERKKRGPYNVSKSHYMRHWFVRKVCTVLVLETLGLSIATRERITLSKGNRIALHVPRVTSVLGGNERSR